MAGSPRGVEGLLLLPGLSKGSLSSRCAHHLCPVAEVRAAEDKIFPSDPSDVQSGPFEAQLTLRGITERVGLGPYLASGPHGILQVSGAPSPLLCLVPSLSLSPLPHSLLSPAPVFLSCSISLIHRRFIPRGPLPFPYLPGSWWPWPEGTELVNSSSPPTCHTPNEAPAAEH